MKSFMRLVIAAILLLMVLVVIWRYPAVLDRLLAESPVPAEIRLPAETKKCLVTHVADDATTATQRRFMAHAVLNHADATGLSVCRIHKEKRVLSAPSQDGKKFPRLTEAADLLERMPLLGDKAGYAAAELEVERILKNRKADYAKEPCLAEIVRYKRPSKWGTWQDEKKFYADGLVLLYDDKQGARFYGPPGSKTKCS